MNLVIALIAATPMVTMLAIAGRDIAVRLQPSASPAARRAPVPSL